MSKIRKAVITAAGRGTRMFPATTTIQKEMLPLMDVDGLTKPAIQIIIEEALESGIEEVCLVVNKHNRSQIERHFQQLTNDEIRLFKGKDWALLASAKIQHIASRLHIVVQQQPDGYGHAVWCAKDFVGDEPFLLMLGDHIYTSGTEIRCARQILDVYEKYETSVSAVQQTPSDLLHLFGTVRGKLIQQNPRVYDINLISEKPSLDFAEENLRVEGLLWGMYLCFFGMHAFTPTIFDSLQYAIDHNLRDNNEIQLTSAQERLRCEGERYLAFESIGERWDIGIPFGYAQTQAALAVNSVFREQMLAALIKMIAIPMHHVPEAFKD